MPDAVNVKAPAILHSPLTGSPGPHGPVDVAIVCEATYPYVTGGLSAVVHQLCTGLEDLRIGIIHVAWDRDAPSTPLYDLPPNVAWVHRVHTSLAEHPEFHTMTLGELGRSSKRRKEIAERFYRAFDSHLAGDDSLLWRLYDEGINPDTRQYSLWPLLATEEFMDQVITRMGQDFSLAHLYWRVRDFASILFALTSGDIPEAKVYHAHTTGACTVLAAAAARRFGGRVLLTEHNLYTRDAINFLLGRSAANPVTSNTWRELAEYVGGEAAHPVVHHVTADQRLWMAWHTALGHLSYRAAHRITYLFPESIQEAKALGSRPEIAEVIANGIDTVPYLPGRKEVAARVAATQEPEHRWRFAYAARVVAIKGLLDLIEAVHQLQQEGWDSFTIDVMGPLGEEPDYVEQCRERIATYHLGERIRLLGSRHIPTTLPNYDMLVLPSHNEGAPVIILEALAMGLPVLATEVGGVAAMVVTPEPDPQNEGAEIGSAGVLAQPGDIDSIAGALRHVMSNPREHPVSARNAVARAERLFHIDIAVGKYRALLQELGATGHPRLPGLPGGSAHPLRHMGLASETEQRPHSRPGQGARRALASGPRPASQPRRAVR